MRYRQGREWEEGSLLSFYEEHKVLGLLCVILYLLMGDYYAYSELQDATYSFNSYKVVWVSLVGQNRRWSGKLVW